MGRTGVTLILKGEGFIGALSRSRVEREKENWEIVGTIHKVWGKKKKKKRMRGKFASVGMWGGTYPAQVEVTCSSLRKKKREKFAGNIQGGDLR